MFTHLTEKGGVAIHFTGTQGGCGDCMPHSSLGVGARRQKERFMDQGRKPRTARTPQGHGRVCSDQGPGGSHT